MNPPDEPSDDQEPAPTNRESATSKTFKQRCNAFLESRGLPVAMDKLAIPPSWQDANRRAVSMRMSVESLAQRTGKPAPGERVWVSRAKQQPPTPSMKKKTDWAAVVREAEQRGLVKRSDPTQEERP